MDQTLNVLRTGYPYFLQQFRKRQTDIFETTLLLSPTTVMRGEEAAKVFYDQDKFQRKGAMPDRVKKTLLGVGGVQGLDGKAHEKRKALFMSCMGRETMGQLRERFEFYWNQRLDGWQQGGGISLFQEAETILLQASCDWVGVPLPADEVFHRRKQLSAMIDAAAALGWRHLRGRKARQETDAWITDIVEQVRSGHLEVGEDSILYRFATARNGKDHLLPTHVAAVEILNLIRPIVAIARYITFAAHALHQHPEHRDALKGADDKTYHRFVQEVRRFYPFFPVAAAVVKNEFEWRGHQFPEGRRVLLDLYGTNHDHATWTDPEHFNPDRFLDWDGSPFNFIPQGGGDFNNNHRCAGEWITIDLTQSSLKFLVEKMEYRVPPQDLRIHLDRIPAIPKSRMTLDRITRAATDPGKN